eukprot:2085576-Alexandrium_andersonii.AAC.1
MVDSPHGRGRIPSTEAHRAPLGAAPELVPNLPRAKMPLPGSLGSAKPRPNRSIGALSPIGQR